MSKDISNKITENQYMAIIQSSMIAIGILTLARTVSKHAHQQGWISVIITGIYPICTVVLAAFIDKEMEHCDFWEINNKIYGKLLAHIITMLFCIMFVFYQMAAISGFVNIIHIILVPFIKPYVIIITITLLSSYMTINGLTIIARLCEVVFYLVIVFIIITLSIIPRGTITNIMPFFSSFKEIIAGMPESLYSYVGIELSYIVISFITNKKNHKKSGIYGVLIVIFSYAANIFVTVYCIGWEMASKLSYPMLYITSTIEISLLENVRTVIMIIWSFVIFRIFACNLFAATYCSSKVLNKSYKTSCVIISILSGILTFFMIPEYNRVKILDKFTIYTFLIGVLWGIITSIIIVFKTRNYKKMRVN